MTSEAALRDKPTLSGTLVILRPFTVDDLEAMAAAIADPEVTRGTDYDLRTDSLEAPAAAVVDDRLRQWYLSRADQPDRLDLAVVDRETGCCVGEVVLNEFEPADGRCNFRTLIGAAGRGRGLGSEATRLIVDYAFSVGIEKVELEVFVSNVRARRAYESAGFRLTGRHTAARLVDGVPEDAFLMTARAAGS